MYVLFRKRRKPKGKTKQHMQIVRHLGENRQDSIEQDYGPVRGPNGVENFFGKNSVETA